ncbi:MAG: hypothetical protein WDM78_05385 [Puia sp.]
MPIVMIEKTMWLAIAIYWLISSSSVKKEHQGPVRVAKGSLYFLRIGCF